MATHVFCSITLLYIYLGTAIFSVQGFFGTYYTSCLLISSLYCFFCWRQKQILIFFYHFINKLTYVFGQGGKFDHADRLFQSIEGTFRNCLSNTSDVKELIPEFFYMPEFLVNSNSYHMGIKQDGEPIGDVCLPPWAKVLTSCYL